MESNDNSMAFPTPERLIEKLRPVLVASDSIAAFCKAFCASSELEWTRAFASRFTFLLWAALIMMRDPTQAKRESLWHAFFHILRDLKAAQSLCTVSEFFVDPFEHRLLIASIMAEGIRVETDNRSPLYLLAERAAVMRMEAYCSYRSKLDELDTLLLAIGSVIQEQVTGAPPSNEVASPAGRMRDHLSCLAAEWETVASLAL
jgi:hypothetical protein